MAKELRAKKVKKGLKTKKVKATGSESSLIRNESLESFGKRNILHYATEVNLDRSVPDLYDGLKPVQRRILWAASQQVRGQFVKSARVVGDVIGKYHPHGDTAVYGAMINMVQAVVPYLEGKGNWGTLVDPAAAHRYTNVRMGAYGSLFFDSDYMHKAVTTFVPNYDDKEVEPVTLPAMLPNVLINGNEGIGWGITTSMPSFTAESVIDILVSLLGGKKLEAEDFAKTLKPALRWGGRIVKSKENRKQWLQMCTSSAASVQYEAELDVDPDKRTITINNWPPGLTPDKFMTKVRALSEVDKVYNSKGTTEFLVSCKRGYNLAQFEALVAKVQKITQVKVAYKINVTHREASIIDGVVGYKTEFLSLSVPELLLRWTKLRLELEKKSLANRIAIKKEQIAYTQLLIYATSILDVIFKSLRKDDSALYISKNSKLSLEQAKLILDLKVRQLSKLDEQDMKKRLKEQQNDLKTLEKWLTRPKAKISADLQQLKTALQAAGRKKVVKKQEKSRK